MTHYLQTEGFGVEDAHPIDAGMEDVFIERINPENPNQYEVNGEWQDMTLRREEITVRGQDEPEIMVVRRTRNGVVITETIFNYPGLGSLMAEAAMALDVPSVLGMTLFSSFVLVFGNLVVDVLYGVVDPRIRLQ